MTQSLALGLDIGGTKVAFALVDEQGVLHQSSHLATDTGSETALFLDRIAAEIENYLSAYTGIAGIGIGCPGYIDSANGIVLNAVNLNWFNMPLRDELAKRLSRSLPIYVQNDGTALALGEMIFGAVQNCSDFVHIAIGTGLGGSAFVKGQQLVGANNYGFEIGHIVRKPHGRLCNCGLHGCTEMYLSGRGVLAALQEYFPDYTSRLNSNSTTAEVLQAARDGDALAVHIMEESAEALAELLSYIIVIINPAKVVIGGGMGLAALDFYLTGMIERFATRMPATSYQNVEILASTISSSAIGSASLVWHSRNTPQQNS
jgi:glucokinase